MNAQIHSTTILVVDVENGTLAQTQRPDGTRTGLEPEAQKNYLATAKDALQKFRDQGFPVGWIKFSERQPPPAPSLMSKSG